MSPNDEFVVAVSLSVRGEIDIIDTVSLDVKAKHQCPIVMKSCHLFGNQPWYIIIRCFNNKFYIMDGVTGELACDPTKVQPNEDILDVSNQGHILLARTSESFTYQHTGKLTNKFRSFTDEDGNYCENMVWCDIVQMSIQNPLNMQSQGMIYLSRDLTVWIPKA